ncbi:MAG: Gldg family protein [Myxococcota bacterium]|nr:Gldg family protein [Myxococcota bacterium]
MNAILRRELKAYFNAPIAYVYILVFVLITNGLYMSSVFLSKRVEMREFFAIMPFVLAIFMPAISMRLWAEDRRQGTFEMLRTMPLTVWQLVAGKFLAGLLFFAIALAATLTVPAFLLSVGSPDMGPILAGYLASLLLGGFFLAVGLFTSGISRDQIVAFILGLVVCFAFVLIGIDLIAVQLDAASPGLGSALKNYVGVTANFQDLTRGVIEFRTVTYFLLMTAGFLVLDVLTVSGITRPAERRTLLATGLAILVVVVGGNLMLGKGNLGKVDLTEEGLYTLNEATGRILSGLESPVELTLYISPKSKMPSQLVTLERDIKDKLKEYVAVSSGNLSLNVVHLDPVEQGLLDDPDEQDDAAKDTLDKLHKKGIKPFQVESIGADENSIRLIYSSLQMVYLDKKPETMSPVMPQVLPRLEYEMISRINRLTRDKKTKVVLLAPIQQTEQNKEMAKLYAQLGQPFKQEELNEFKVAEQALRQLGDHEVHRLRSNTSDKPLPMDADLVVLLAPAPLDPKRVDEMKTFMHSGKPVVLAVQRNRFGYNTDRSGVSVRNDTIDPGLDGLLTPLGVNVANQVVMESPNNTQRLSLGGGRQMGPFRMATPVELPPHAVVTPERMNNEVSLTNGLPGLIYLWGSPITTDDAKMQEADVRLTELFSSSDDAWTIESRSHNLQRADIVAKDGSRLLLAALLEYSFPALSGAESGEEKGPDWKAEAGETQPGERTRMVLFGNGEMFKDQLLQGGGGGHMKLLLNSVDALTQGDDLVSIRSKEPVPRMMEGKISAGDKTFYRTFVIAGSPLLFLGFGVVSLLRRRQRRELWMSARKEAA